MGSAGAMGEAAAASAAALESLLRERDEEVEYWRIRCLQAQAEARALQKAAKALGGSGDDGGRGAGAAPSSQPLPGATEPPEGQGPAADTASKEQVEDARRHLEHKSEMLSQLEADYARDLQNLRSRHWEAEEVSAVCNEELFQMTRRAESLSEQVRRSRGVSGEVQAVREEATRLRLELSEAEAAATRQSQFVGVGAMADADISALVGPCGLPWEASEVLREIDEVRQLHTELEQELRPAASQRTRPSRAPPSRGPVKQPPTPTGADRLLRQIARQLDVLEQAASSQEGAELFPMDGRDFDESVWAIGQAEQGLCVDWEADVSLVLQQRLSDARVAAEEMRERAIVEHCNDIDELERRHARERAELRAEIRELRSERSRAEVDAAIARPVHELRARLVGQMDAMRKEFAVQLADICRLEQQDLGCCGTWQCEALRDSFDDCQAELQAWRSELRTLRDMFQREQRAHKQLRECQHQHDSVFAPAPGAAAGARAGAAPAASAAPSRGEAPRSPGQHSAAELTPEPTEALPRSWAPEDGIDPMGRG